MKTNLTQKQPPLTGLQKDTLKVITQFYRKYGYPCSQTYVSNYFNISKSSGRDRINALINKGLIKKTPNGQVYPQITK